MTAPGDPRVAARPRMRPWHFILSFGLSACSRTWCTRARGASSGRTWRPWAHQRSSSVWQPEPGNSSATAYGWSPVPIIGFWLKFREAWPSCARAASRCTFSSCRGRGVRCGGPGHRHRAPGLPHEPGVDPRRDQPAASFTKLEPEPIIWHLLTTLNGILFERTSVSASCRRADCCWSRG